MAILGAVQVPHPPLILPEVGHGEEKRIQSTIDAFERAAKFIAELRLLPYFAGAFRQRQHGPVRRAPGQVYRCL